MENKNDNKSEKKRRLSVDIFAFVGILLWLAYTLINRFVADIPDVAAYPWMIISCGLMMVGLWRTGWRWGKGIKK